LLPGSISWSSAASSATRSPCRWSCWAISKAGKVPNRPATEVVGALWLDRLQRCDKSGCDSRRSVSGVRSCSDPTAWKP
jgi:hypothetical protein